MSKIRDIFQFILVIGTVLLLVVLGWHVTSMMRNAITRSAIDAYQQTEMEVVRSVARSAEYYASRAIESGSSDAEAIDRIEQEIFSAFVEPVRLLENGDAWIYAPDHVVYDKSSDFPEAYRGKSMGEIFEMQKLEGASHYSEMADDVKNGRAGVGWYVWLPEKGKEIAAWTPVRAGKSLWVIGLSTPLPEILQSTGASSQIRSTWILMAAMTVLALALLVVWTVTEIRRRRMEEALRENERRFESVVDTAADAIVTVDPSGRIVSWNGAAERQFGCPSRNALGATLDAFLLTENGERPVSWGSASGEAVRYLGVRANGIRFPADVSSAAWSAHGGFYTTHIIRDMSLHEDAERQRWDLEQKLQRAQRMESLGILAGGVAHDLNNMLTPIVGYADILAQDVPADSPLRNPLIELQRSGKKAGAIVQDLLTLGRRGSYEMAPLDLSEIAREFLRSAQFIDARQRNPNVIVEDRLGAECKPIMGSAPHLTTVLLNLALNAFEAMPKGGRMLIGTSHRFLEAPYLGYEKIVEGEYTVLEVEDTGIGIEAQDLERIFEPFYTKKKMGRSGSGLGLAVVYGVVQDHHGRVDLRSEPGKSTRFSLWFPCSEEKPALARPEPRDLRGTEAVLVVDDQVEQRTVASMLLSRYGYSVATAEHGRAAVAYLRDHSPDILVLDMIMQEDFDGLDCWREIVRIRPDQKAIIVSGFAETERVKEAKRLGAGEFVRKPYTAEELAAAIRRELARSKRT
jgi:two-component system cell cycle sensor histidine kinase/response regulator CckA